MRTVPICFSALQAPRGKIHRLFNLYWENFHSLSWTRRKISGFKQPASKTYGYGLEGGYSRRWIRRPVTTKTEGRNKTNQSSRPSNIVHEILDGNVSTGTTLSVNKTDMVKPKQIQFSDMQQNVAENNDTGSLATVIVFDLETTGLSREYERIIEIALQDLSGGKNSTFHTLVNPDRYVPNPHVHGITTHMVRRPDVPRMEELIPILLQYVKSRQKADGHILWAAHNGRSFDVPFLINEFNRCSFEIPSNWLFVDTLALARKLVKSGGSNVPSGLSLKALSDHYNVQFAGKAHRAINDVMALSLVLQRLTFDLKLSPSCLLEESFSVFDLNTKKKKNST